MHNQSSLPQDFSGPHGRTATERRERKPNHYYRTEIPNVIFELGLDPYCIRVYLQINKIIGDKGVCQTSYVTLAKDCGMGESKFKRCIKKLASPNEFLVCPLIKVTPRRKEDGSRDINDIKINDIRYILYV